MIDKEYLASVPVAVEMDRDTGFDDPQLRRRAFRRVFDPNESESASDEDRKVVMQELRDICYYNKSFEPQMGTSDVGYQIAGMEGSRRVYLKIIEAIRLSRGDDLKAQLPSQIARTE